MSLQDRKCVSRYTVLLIPHFLSSSALILGVGKRSAVACNLALRQHMLIVRLYHPSQTLSYSCSLLFLHDRSTEIGKLTCALPKFPPRKAALSLQSAASPTPQYLSTHSPPLPGSHQKPAYQLSSPRVETGVGTHAATRESAISGGTIVLLWDRISAGRGSSRTSVMDRGARVCAGCLRRNGGI